jgi:hypothetical protein
LISKPPSPKAKIYSAGPEFPFEKILSSPEVKGKAERETAVHATKWSSSDRPIIVHFHDICTFEKEGYLTIMTGFRDSLLDPGVTLGRRNILIIATGSTSALAADDQYFMESIGTKTMKDPVLMVPIRSNLQKKLFDKDQKAEQSLARLNINQLRRAIRQLCPFDRDNITTLSLAQPYSKWDFLENTRTLERLGTGSLDDREIAKILREIGQDCTIAHIQEVILRVRMTNDIVDEWYKENTREHFDSRWQNLSVKAQSAIREIENWKDVGEEEKYKWEKVFIDLIIDPGGSIFFLLFLFLLVLC